MLHNIHNIFHTSKSNTKNIKEYGRATATQAGEKIEQNITWYIL